MSTPPTVEVLAIRDPDAGTDLVVFINGQEVTFTQEVVDAGYGSLRSDWDAHTNDVAAGRDSYGTYSAAFRDAVVDARHSFDDSPYILQEDD